MEPAGGPGLDSAVRAFPTSTPGPSHAPRAVPQDARQGLSLRGNLHLRTQGKGLASTKVLSGARIPSFPLQPVWGGPQPSHPYSQLYWLAGDPGHTPKATLRPGNLSCTQLLKVKVAQLSDWACPTLCDHHSQQKSPKCSTWMQSQKRQKDLCSFPRKTIQYHSNPSLCPDQ